MKITFFLLVLAFIGTNCAEDEPAVDAGNVQPVQSSSPIDINEIPAFIKALIEKIIGSQDKPKDSDDATVDSTVDSPVDTAVDPVPSPDTDDNVDGATTEKKYDAEVKQVRAAHRSRLALKHADKHCNKTSNSTDGKKTRAAAIKLHHLNTKHHEGNHNKSEKCNNITRAVKSHNKNHAGVRLHQTKGTKHQ